MFRRCSTPHYCLSSTPHYCLSSTPHRCISISPEAREVSSLPPPLLPSATPCLCSQPPRVPVLTPLPPCRLRSTAAPSSLHYRCFRRLSVTFALPLLPHTRIAIAPSHSRRPLYVLQLLSLSLCSANQETVQKVCDIVKKQLALPEGSSVTGESKIEVLQLNMANVLLEKGRINGVHVNSVGAKVLEFIADFGKPTAPLPAAIVACVPTKVHIQGAGKTEFKISPTEITDAMKAGLDQPIMPEPEIVALFVQSDTMLWLIDQDEEHENKGKDESCEAFESGAS
ncbi:hypothetical protein HN873_034294 [Arachis hypogaea]